MYLVYNARQMSHYIEWRMMGEGQYAVGIERCTNSFGRKKVRDRGELLVLALGEARTYDLEVGLLESGEKIRGFRSIVLNSGNFTSP